MGGDHILLVASQPYPAPDEYVLHLSVFRDPNVSEDEMVVENGKPIGYRQHWQPATEHLDPKDSAIRFLTYHLTVEGRVKFDMQDEKSEQAPDEEDSEELELDTSEAAAPS